MTDDEYMRTQQSVELLASLLLGSFEEGELEGFLERADRAQAIGPILNPSEWQDGTGKLREVQAHARALLAARNKILHTLGVPA